MTKGKMHRELGDKDRSALTACAMGQMELESLQGVIEDLALAGPFVAPPPRLRDRIRRIPRQAEPILIRDGEGEWKKIFEGVERKILFREGQGSSVLIRVAAKSFIPAHEHSGAEQCLVIEGELQDGDVVFRKGDYVVMPAGSAHSPLYSETGCTALVWTS